jgi:hypothetical protein
MAGCAESPQEQSDSCCQQGSCSRKPQHSHDCPYKLLAAHQAEAKYNLTPNASPGCQVAARTSVALTSQAATLAAPVTVLPESDRFLKLRILRI